MVPLSLLTLILSIFSPEQLTLWQQQQMHISALRAKILLKIEHCIIEYLRQSPSPELKGRTIPLSPAHPPPSFLLTFMQNECYHTFVCNVNLSCPLEVIVGFVCADGHKSSQKNAAFCRQNKVQTVATHRNSSLVTPGRAFYANKRLSVIYSFLLNGWLRGWSHCWEAVAITLYILIWPSWVIQLSAMNWLRRL